MLQQSDQTLSRSKSGEELEEQSEQASEFFFSPSSSPLSTFRKEKKRVLIRNVLLEPPSGPLHSNTFLLKKSVQTMNEPPPEGVAAVQAAATGNAGRHGTSDDDQAATTASTEQAPVATPQANLKLRNDRGPVELSEDGFSKVRLTALGWGRCDFGVGESLFVFWLLRGHWNSRHVTAICCTSSAFPAVSQRAFSLRDGCRRNQKRR